MHEVTSRRAFWARWPRWCGLGLVALLGAAVAALGFGQNPFVPVRIMVPLYSDPGDGWLLLARSAPAAQIAIINPFSGPGHGRSRKIALGIAALGPDIAPIGYIATSYGKRPLGAVEAEIKDYASWYKVQGIFLDNTPSRCSAASVRYYKTIAHAIKVQLPHALIVMNPGVLPGACYGRLANLIVTYEGSLAGYRSYRPAAWMQRYSRSHFAALVWGVPGAALSSAVDQAQGKRFGYLYITGAGGKSHPNAYDRLPTYFQSEVQAVRRLPLGFLLPYYSASVRHQGAFLPDLVKALGAIGP